MSNMASGYQKILENRLTVKPEMIRVTVEIPMEERTRLKMLAVSWRTSMVDVLRRLISKFPDG